jgi:hypothetical protein
VRRTGDIRTQDGLWSGERDLLFAEDGASASAIDAAARQLGDFPELFEHTVLGRRLSESVVLGGITAARFTAEALPALRQLPDVTVEESGTARDLALSSGRRGQVTVPRVGRAKDGGDPSPPRRPDQRSATSTAAGADTTRCSTSS